MWKDKPTGIKILWLWTIGTAVVLMTTVSRTRLRDMEKLMEQQQQLQQEPSSSESSMVENSLPSDGFVREDKN